jgi:adhesin transport system membrane fusion protein
MTTTMPMLPAVKLAGTTNLARRLANVLMILFILAAVSLLFAPWVQNVQGFGRVVAQTPDQRQQTIGAPVEGRIVRWSVIEGSRVKRGDVIAEIADNDPQILSRLEEERNAILLRMEQAKTRSNATESRIAQLDAFRRNQLQVGRNDLSAAVENVKAAEQVIKAAEASLVAATQNIERQKQLLAKGLVAVRNVELAEQDYARAQAEVDRAKAALGSALNVKAARESDLLRIESDFQSRIDDARASLASANADVANTLAEVKRIEVRVARQTRQTVAAPRDGVILRLLAQPGGEFLKAGDPVAFFVPESDQLVVELFMSGNDVPLIHPGDKVRLQFEGWPAIQFAGWPSVAVGTFGGQVFLVDATDSGDGKFRILVEPDPKDEAWPTATYLRQGVRANGWVLLREVPLGFELWRQFNGFPPTVTPQSEPTGGSNGKSGSKKT